jgi:Uncharacterized conserved protein
MELYVLIGISLIVVTVIFFITIFNYRNKYVIYDIKLDSSSNELDVLYVTKKQLITSIVSRVGEVVDKELVPNIDEVVSEDLSRFELSKILNDMESKLLEEMTLRRAFVPDEELAGLFTSLEDISIDCTSVEQYYNDNASYFNKLLKKFPSNIVGKFKRHDVKEMYDYEKEEMFEILKD